MIKTALPPMDITLDLSQAECQIDEMVLSYMTEVETIDSPRNYHSYDHILKTILFFSKYRELFIQLEGKNYSYLLLDRLNGYFENYVARPEWSFVKRTYLYFYTGALYNIFMQWINSTKPENAETVAHQIHRLAAILQNEPVSVPDLPGFAALPC